MDVHKVHTIVYAMHIQPMPGEYYGSYIHTTRITDVECAFIAANHASARLAGPGVKCKQELHC